MIDNNDDWIEYWTEEKRIKKINRDSGVMLYMVYVYGLCMWILLRLLLPG